MSDFLKAIQYAHQAGRKEIVLWLPFPSNGDRYTKLLRTHGPRGEIFSSTNDHSVAIFNIEKLHKWLQKGANGCYGLLRCIRPLGSQTADELIDSFTDSHFLK